MNESVRTKIQSLERNMTKSDMKVARLILSDYPSVGLHSLAEIGEQADVSAATVLRFVSKLGFEGFPAFQESLKAELQQSFSSPLDRFEKGAALMQSNSPLERYASYASELMQTAAKMVSGYEFGTISSLLSETKRPVHVIGGRFSRSIAELFCYGFGQVRGDCHTVQNDALSMVECLMNVRKRDLVIVFDFRRYQGPLESFCKHAAGTGATIILVTDQWQSPIQKIANHVLTVPVESPSTFDSGLAAVMCVEALIDDVSRKLQDQVPARIAKFETMYDEFK
ncbi:MurR/RpiR family transcriptional regulator [Nitratireductor aquibiodomus]|uniref:MurR/RpiR family transcriptional regulator n=1 Tax=Nitratireductor aquibiodomus TaxID=204799 RepID=UPI0004685DB3|nr:MurR/RpiR family transcriptional regulator [Nitratireductor aquibiodomus]